MKAVQVKDNNDDCYVALFTANSGEVKISVPASGQQIKGSTYSVKFAPLVDYAKMTTPSKIVNKISGGRMGIALGLLHVAIMVFGQYDFVYT